MSLDRTDLLQLLEWLTDTGHSYGLPIGPATKSLERYTSRHGIDPEIQTAARRFAAVLRQGGDKDAKRLATLVDQICASLPQEDDEDEPGELRVAPTPSAVGDPLVLVPLKVMLGILTADIASETTVCGPDRYAMLTHSPLTSAHAFVMRLLEEKIQAVKWGTDMDAFAAGQVILGLDPSPRSMVLIAVMERNMASLLGPSLDYNDQPFWKSHSTLPGIVSRLRRESVSLNRALLFDLILYLATASGTFSSNLGRAYLILGRSQQTRGKRDEARAAFRSATENLEHTLGPGHPETRTARQLAEIDNPQM